MKPHPLARLLIVTSLLICISATAQGQAHILTLDSSPANGGTVEGAGKYEHDAEVKITAQPALGYRFSHWEGKGPAEPEESTTSVKMENDWTITAKFVKTWPLKVTSAPLTGGGGAFGQGTFADGTLAPIAADPANGYEFVGWKGEGITDPSSFSTTVLMTESRTVTAVFEKPKVTLTLVSNPTQGGTTTGAGQHGVGDTPAVVATPAVGYRFAQWEGSGIADTSSPQTSITMDRDRTAIAYFVKTWSLKVSTSPLSGAGVTIGQGTFDEGTLASIAVDPANGYQFVRWTGEGITDPSSPATTVLMTEARTVTAVLEKPMVTLRLNSHPVDGGATTGAGSHEVNEAPAITATPALGYRFAQWEGSGIADTSSAQTSITMNQDRSATAYFIKTWALKIGVSPLSGGSISGQGTYDDGTVATISADPRGKFRFVRWEGDGIEDPFSPVTTVKMTASHTAIAIFETDPLAISIAYDYREEAAKITVEGGLNRPYRIDSSSDNRTWTTHSTFSAEQAATTQSISVKKGRDSYFRAQFTDVP